MRRLLTVLAISLCVVACSKDSQTIEPVPSNKSLEELSKDFAPRVEKVTEGVYVAVGYGLANSIMIEGDDGVIIVDVTESIETANAVKAEFDKITTKPVKAIIYTHNHADHIFGGPAFVGDTEPEVYAHELTNDAIDKVLSLIRPIIRVRSYRMFGLHLQEGSVPNAGIGPGLKMQEGTTIGLIRPTQTFTDQLDLEISGVKLSLMHAPGETEDQLLVWLPDQKVLLPGDNIYKAFPNLYTIRGTAFRDPTDWVKSLDKMRYLQPEFLVPSHTAPLQGANKIQAVLTDYRDAIQYLHDQTVRGMNLGKTADEIVEEMMLPTHLRQSEYLKEFYGDINLCVRSIFNGYLGPFDGNPTNLTSLTGRQRAGRMARLVGGQDVLKTKLSEAIAEEEYQWALELSDHLKWLTPDDETVTQLRITALENLAANTINPNLRHYYLSVASELNGTPNTPFNGPTIELAHEVTLDTIFRVMPTTLVASKAQKLDQLVIFEFPDVNQTYSVHIRHGIAEIQPFALPNPHNTVTMDSLVFKEIVAQLRNPMKTLSAGEMQITGSSLDLAYFMQLFKPIE